MIIILIILCLCLCISSSASLIGFYIYNPLFFSDLLNTEEKTLTEETPTAIRIKCKIGQDEYKCQLEDSTYIKITQGSIIKISSSIEEDKKSLYFIVPYVFLVTYPIKFAKDQIKITNLYDLLKTFEQIEIDFNSTNNTPDKCLNTTLEVRNKSEPPYNTTCLFNYKFSSIKGLTDVIKSSFIKFISKDILDQYVIHLDQKIKTSRSLTIFEYAMYLSIKNTSFYITTHKSTDI